MIVEFFYTSRKNKEKSKPLFFVMDTEERTSTKKKKISGINLNYLPYFEIESFFLKLLTKTDWELDKHTGAPKVNLWEEEDPGVRPIILYNAFVKKHLLERFSCWRTYKYKTAKEMYQILYHFRTPPLNLLYKGMDEEEPGTKVLHKVSNAKMYNMLRSIDPKSV